MKMIPSVECPKCGCKVIGRGYHLKNGAMLPYGGVFKSSAVVYEICTRAGISSRAMWRIRSCFICPKKRRKRNNQSPERK